MRHRKVQIDLNFHHKDGKGQLVSMSYDAAKQFHLELGEALNAVVMEDKTEGVVNVETKSWAEPAKHE
jgi:hypothetical protein